MHFRRLASLALLAALTSSASAGPLRDFFATRHAARTGGDQLPAGVTLVRDVSYGSDPRQTFDVYIPKAAAKAPVIFMVHGGAWKTGDKGADRVAGNKVAYWCARGYILVSANYRMLPDADPLTQARDVASAIAEAQAKAAGWGGDRAQFILMGHSAGAHLVALLSSSPALAGPLRWLGTVALDSAALDIEQIMQGRHMRLYDDAFGKDLAYWRAISPYAQLAQAGQPLLAVCSSQRSDSCEQARRYAAKAGGFGTRVQVSAQDLSHMEINQSLGQEGAYTQAVDQFIRSLLPGPR